jgi:hypothetical protein
MQHLNSICINQRDAENNDEAAAQKYAAITTTKRIRLYKCDKITSRGLKDLIASKGDSLEELEIVCCVNIEASAFNSLRILRNLKRLRINHCRLNNEALWDITTFCTKLSYLDVRETDIDSWGFTFLRNLDVENLQLLTDLKEIHVRSEEPFHVNFV